MNDARPSRTSPGRRNRCCFVTKVTRSGVSTRLASASARNQLRKEAPKSAPSGTRLIAPPSAESAGDRPTAIRKNLVNAPRSSIHSAGREIERNNQAERRAFSESFAQHAARNHRGVVGGTNRNRRIGSVPSTYSHHCRG